MTYQIRSNANGFPHLTFVGFRISLGVSHEQKGMNQIIQAQEDLKSDLAVGFPDTDIESFGCQCITEYSSLSQ